MKTSLQTTILRRTAHKFLLFLFYICFGLYPSLAFAVSTAATPIGQGSLSGTINIFRTKVKTKGPKSDKNIIVYLERLDGEKPSPVSKLVSMDQQGLVFIPHVLPVQLGTTVEFLNNDNVDHNVYFLFEKTGKTLDLGTWPKGVSVKHTFTEKDAVIVLCKLHLEMAAYVVVLDSPYYTTVSIEEKSQMAQFKIANVPSGKYRIHTWHKKLKLKGGPREIQIEEKQDVQTDLTITKRKYAK